MAQQGNVQRTRVLPGGEGMPVRLRRFVPLLASLGVAGALVLTIGLFLRVTETFPLALQMALMLVLFVLAARSREWGYYAALLILAWPLVTLSPTLMVLVVGALLAARRVMVAHLPWALLVSMTWLLAGWQVVALVPLLAGALAGPRVGWWSGVASALGLKLVAGLAGVAVPELGALHGVLLPIQQIAERAEIAGLIGVLGQMVEPLGGSAALVALHLIQIVAWGGAGWLVGHLRQHSWAEGTSLPLVLVLAPALLLMWSSVYLLPSLLGWQPWGTFLRYPGPTVGLAVAGLAVALLLTLVESLRPLLIEQVPRRGYISPRYTRSARRRATPHDDAADEPLVLEMDERQAEGTSGNGR